MFNLTFNKIKTFLNKLIDVLIPLFWYRSYLELYLDQKLHLLEDVYTNVSNVMSMLGEDGLLALISIIIILSYLKKN